MKKNSAVIIGAGGHASAVLNLLESSQVYDVKGCIGFDEEMGKTTLGYEVIATDRDLARIRKSVQVAFNGIGQIKDPTPRIQAFNLMISLDFLTPILIASTAVVSASSVIGDGSIIMNGAFVGPNVRIGKNCIVNTGAILEHDVIIADHSHISTGVILNGGASVGEGTFIGSGSVVRESTLVGSFEVIPMGSILKESPRHGRN